MNTVKYLAALLMVITLCSCREQHSQPATGEAAQDNLFKSDSGFADVNGINMYYEIYGKGFPLVLIHGGGSTINTSFGKIIPLLAKSHQVIAVETQAHGRTGDRDTAESFEQDADDVNELLKKLNIKKSDVMGFSNGGSTALQMAIRHPGSVNRVVAISPLCSRDGVTDGFWDFMEKGTFDQLPQAYKAEFLRVNNDSSKLRIMYNKDSRRMLTFKDWDESKIRTIQCPVLLLGGDRDVIIPAHLFKISSLIRDSRVCVLPGQHGEFMGEITFKDDTKKITEATAGIINHFLTARP